MRRGQNHKNSTTDLSAAISAKIKWRVNEFIYRTDLINGRTYKRNRTDGRKAILLEFVFASVVSNGSLISHFLCLSMSLFRFRSITIVDVPFSSLFNPPHTYPDAWNTSAGFSDLFLSAKRLLDITFSVNHQSTKILNSPSSGEFAFYGSAANWKDGWESLSLKLCNSIIKRC